MDIPLKFKTLSNLAPGDFVILRRAANPDKYFVVKEIIDPLVTTYQKPTDF